MSFFTTADIQGDYYGYWKTVKKVLTFRRCGRKITLERILESIETGKFWFTLLFDYLAKPRRITIPRQEMAETSLITTLSAAGADATRQHFDTLVDTIRMQEYNLADEGYTPERVYEHLGWINDRCYDENGNIIGTQLCYRAATLVGGKPATYVGPYKVTTMGSFDAWRDMVKSEVVGHTAMEVVLVAGLSAVVNGLISHHTTAENPIVHLNYGSRTGKTTTTSLAASVFGEAFNGEREVSDRHGNFKRYKSIHGTWGATDNAVILDCAGNRGAVIVLNELGKFRGKDMSYLVFDLSEGSDKKRSNGQLEVTLSQGYDTTIISCGEASLLGRCQTKLDGLANRVLEIEKPLTTDADHAARIKQVVANNNGHAAPMLAKYILDSGGLDYALAIYRKWEHDLKATLPQGETTGSFIEKFAALFMATAEMATAALGIDFDLKGLQKFFEEHELENGAKRNVAATSYEAILEACRTNINSFYREGKGEPFGRAYGRVDYPNKLQSNGMVLVEEYMVRQDFLEETLAKHHFPNLKTCARQWKQMGVLDYEKGRNTRSRHIDPSSTEDENIYVFPIYQQATVANTMLAKPKQKKSVQSTIVASSKAASLKSGSKMDNLLGDDEDDLDEKEVDNNGTHHADN